MTNQQHASRGIVGRKYAASFYGHDGGLGKAISSEFTIDRDYLHFKIAGGSEKEILGVHLMVDGQSVYQEVGKKNNDLEWRTWNIKKFLGKKGQVKLVDESKGGWGFVSADHFVLSDLASTPSQALSHASTLNWGAGMFQRGYIWTWAKSRCYFLAGACLMFGSSKKGSDWRFRENWARMEPCCMTVEPVFLPQGIIETKGRLYWI